MFTYKYSRNRIEGLNGYEIEQDGKRINPDKVVVLLNRLKVNSNCDIKPGDVAIPNSGGPLMTVGKVEGDNALCGWFDDGVQYHTIWWPKESLTIMPPDIVRLVGLAW